MGGLTSEGFTPDSYDDVSTRIESRLLALDPNIDLSPESPDGQLVAIMSAEIAQCWSELNLVYNSYNPDQAVGAGLRNIGMISGLPYGAATSSQTVVELTGVAGAVIPKGSVVANGNGDEFYTAFAATIPASVQVFAAVAGPIPVDAGTITNIVSTITGWDGVNNPSSGKVGLAAMSEVVFRNLRNKAVLRNYTSAAEVIKARLSEDLQIEQVVVEDNDSPTTSPSGVPANTIHVTVGELAANTTDEEIAQIIADTKGLGCPTFGSTYVEIEDSQGLPHKVYFSKAGPQAVFMDIEILFLDDDYAGAEESIRNDLLAHINGLAAGEDVIWSRLFGVITPYSKAQVNKLELSKDGMTYVAGNLSIADTEYPNSVSGNINITVVN